MDRSIFITGIGTGIGKTLISAILVEALRGDYWKPIQAGYTTGTDSDWIRSLIPAGSTVFPEAYKLRMAASPHIAAEKENQVISLEKIVALHNSYKKPGKNLIIEGAGGLMVPLNGKELVADLIQKLEAGVILVSRNYLGSINHSLLTAAVCRQRNIDVLGWIFNDQFMDYEEDIVNRTNYPCLASVGKLEKIDSGVIKDQANRLRGNLTLFID
jgi:dethiobiotin synthetase